MDDIKLCDDCKKYGIPCIKISFVIGWGECSGHGWRVSWERGPAALLSPGSLDSHEDSSCGSSERHRSYGNQRPTGLRTRTSVPGEVLLYKAGSLASKADCFELLNKQVDTT